ncbi:unnamed protein product [Ambrosiozyma monospora]|uniref:Unnamed protein product n=1 Tax=Ambrosiozyma monospora TaxID=43982 RepID=A0A9W7DJZ1_AMBMO|nr:unnamed protein product [Ambrosiozyma monospora]
MFESDPNQLLTVSSVQNFINELPQDSLRKLELILDPPSTKSNTYQFSQLDCLSFRHLYNLKELKFTSLARSFNVLPWYDLSNLPQSLTSLTLDLQVEHYLSYLPPNLRHLDMNLTLINSTVDKFWRTYLSPMNQLTTLAAKVNYTKCIDLRGLNFNNLRSVSFVGASLSDEHDSNVTTILIDSSIIAPGAQLLSFKMEDRLFPKSEHHTYMKFDDTSFNNSFNCSDCGKELAKEMFQLKPSSMFTWFGDDMDFYYY